MARDGSCAVVGNMVGYVKVYTFDSNRNQFSPTENITQGMDDGSLFGFSVSLSFNGTRMIVGLPYNDEGGTDIGRSFVYAMNDDHWKLMEEFGGEAAWDYSGYSVSISGNGS